MGTQYQESNIVRFLLPMELIPSADFPVIIIAWVITVNITD